MRPGIGWLAIVLVGCSPGAATTRAEDRTPPAAAAPNLNPTPIAEPPASAAEAPPELRPAPAEGSVAAIVEGELAAARTDGRSLVVVVGATWCEPCVAFHDALVGGALDRPLAGVRFLEFDLDRDRTRLEEAGYTSRLIPLFVLPGDDGRATARRIEGGIKGDGAVDHILRRLQPLLAGAR